MGKGKSKIVVGGSCRRRRVVSSREERMTDSSTDRTTIARNVCFHSRPVLYQQLPASFVPSTLAAVSTHDLAAQNKKSSPSSTRPSLSYVPLSLLDLFIDDLPSSNRSPSTTGSMPPVSSPTRPQRTPSRTSKPSSTTSGVRTRPGPASAVLSTKSRSDSPPLDRSQMATSRPLAPSEGDPTVLSEYHHHSASPAPH